KFLVTPPFFAKWFCVVSRLNHGKAKRRDWDGATRFVPVTTRPATIDSCSKVTIFAEWKSPADILRDIAESNRSGCLQAPLGPRRLRLVLAKLPPLPSVP